MGKKLTIEHIRGKYEEMGYTLTSTEYINSKTKLNYICPKGHSSSITWSDFKSGRGCQICGIELQATKRRLVFADVIRSFENEWYVVLSDTYTNVDQKLDLLCNNGHKCSISYHNWKAGWRCIECRGERYSTMFSGEGNPSWKGGISCDPYCDAWADKEYKESIKERDGYRCQNPYCSCNGGIEDLCIHHINFNKKNCNPNNLITVCRSCNSFANKDRDWHIAWYQAFMSNKYGYVYV